VSLLEPLDQQPSVQPATKRKKKLGRPRCSEAQRQQEERLVNDWEKARERGVAKKDFTKDRGMTVKELDRAVDRVKKRGKRSPTKS
jgi:imidazolonepropionase-like amidohydrolase